MRKLLVGFSALGVLFCAAPAFAGFAVSATGNVPGTLSGLVTPPVNAQADTASTYQIWNEQQGTLASPVAVDNNGAVASYSGLSPGTPTVLGAGTPFGTTYIQLNPGVNAVVHSGVATILFSSKIIGLALSFTKPDGQHQFARRSGYNTYSATEAALSNNFGSVIGKTNQFWARSPMAAQELQVVNWVQITSASKTFASSRRGTPRSCPSPLR